MNNTPSNLAFPSAPQEKNPFTDYGNVANRAWLKASLENGMITDKKYIEELQTYPLEERKLGDFYGEKKEEQIAFNNELLVNEEILSTKQWVEELFQ
ncbi:MAG: hypothetical protein LBP53_05240 [Candidatus Peribacteria bacterium]|jgi:hypothetical protein|nr:hypothetical protein [Candidatus Peribacteria bacterium]